MASQTNCYTGGYDWPLRFVMAAAVAAVVVAFWGKWIPQRSNPLKQIPLSDTQTDTERLSHSLSLALPLTSVPS